MATALNRVIRVFVSSTFQDLKAERDELILRVFPRLRRLCAQRGVVWGEVDLRWGIPEEAKAEGKVLPLCLAEIHRCRPYFIGLLSERYGWVPLPGDIPPELLRLEPWLKNHQETSITELEILHGVLNDPEMAKQAFFYFRDPKYVERLPAEERVSMVEGPTPEELEALGLEEAERRAEARRQKLAALKERLRQAWREGRLKNPVRENFTDPQTLGEWVYQDLKAVIDELFPETEIPDSLAREREEHEAYARSRTVIEVRPGVFQGVYLARPEYFHILDEHVWGDGPPLVILGESGVGKSALLANWMFHFRNSLWASGASGLSKGQPLKCARKNDGSSGSNPQDPFLMVHFVGASGASTDWQAMVRRFLAELQAHFSLSEKIPEKPEELPQVLEHWLHMAAAKGRVILIIDGLNQLEDKEGALDLAWLPLKIPGNIRLILATLPGRPLEELKRRGWLAHALTVNPLTLKECLAFIPLYLRQYGKELSPRLVDLVAHSPQSANPLFLRTLLEELRVYGDHHTLETRLKHYLEAQSADALFEKVLERWEEHYDGQRPGLVREAMCMLWAARRGLSEAELLELLGRDGQPLPHACWSPLFLAAEASLVNRSGRLGFGHPYLRQAVENRYLPDPEARRKVHLCLAHYFAKGGVSILRQIDELPWQLAQAQEWGGLYILLSHLPFLGPAWEANPFEIQTYWTLLEKESPFRMVEAYAPVLAEPKKFFDYLWPLSLLFHRTGHYQEASHLLSHMTDHFRQAGNLTNLSKALNNLAVINMDWGQLEKAMELFQTAENIARELGDVELLHNTLGNQALILHGWGRLKEALDLLQEQERLCRALGDKGGLQGALGHQALILMDWGQLDKAIALLKEQERLCRELGHKVGLYRSLGNQALILRDWGHLQEALDLHKEEERLCRELGDKKGLATSLGNQALILKEWGQLSEAMILLQEKARLCRQLKDKDGLQSCLGNQALIHIKCQNFAEGMKLLEEQENLCRELGNKLGLSRALGNQAAILLSRRQFKKAMHLFQEQERLLRELDNKKDLQTCLGNQAWILMEWDQLPEAMNLLKEKERLCRELGYDEGLALCLTQQALLLRSMGKIEEGMTLLKEALHLAISQGNQSLIQKIFKMFKVTLV